MITKIKNLTTEKIVFDKLEVEASGELVLKWNKTNMTYDAFTALLNTYVKGDIDFLNNKDKSLKKVKKSNYFIYDKKNIEIDTKTGKKKERKKTKKTQKYDVAIIKMNKQFNEMLEGYIED